jgi:hypothetical protein
MTATTRPSDLDAWKAIVRAVTGLSAIEVGDLPNASHKSDGGRHCGVQDIKDIGRYIPPAKGKTTDYSVIQSWDKVGGNDTCASDIGDDWPNGGRKAWQAFGINVAWELQNHPELLPALCEINWLNAAGEKKRYYIVTGKVVDSTDSVDIHTHLGFKRNSANTPARAATLHRLHAHLIAARGNISVSAALAQLDGGTDVAFDQGIDDMEWRVDALFRLSPIIGGGRYKNDPVPFVEQFKKLQQDVATILARPAATLTPEQLQELTEGLQAGLSGTVSEATKATFGKAHFTFND